MRHFTLSLALALTLVPSLAQAAQPAEAPCLSAAEFTALSTYALPSVVKGVGQRCAATLPAGSWIKQNGAKLADQYAQGRTASWPTAKATFIKMSEATGNADATNILKALPDDSLRQMFDGLITGMVAQKLPVERCGTIDNLVRLMSPLPAQNIAEIIAIAAGLAAKSERAKVGIFSICPA